MWCFVSLPDSVVTEFELTEKALGQQLLDQVCQRLGIIEVDYFGLQFSGPKGETLWLNTRNRISRQVSGNPPYRLSIRVKFFVQPHFLLQDSSRHLYFLHLKKDFTDGKLTTPHSRISHLYSLIAQASNGDHIEGNSPCSYCKNSDGECRKNWTSDSVASAHAKLRGLKPSTAEYHFLKELANLENYGTEFHMARNTEGNHLNIGVSSEELRIYDAELNIFAERISYNGLKMATHMGKSLYLTIMGCDGDHILELKLHTQGAACALYRSITEYHAFYRCETVRNAVKCQFTRDFKETFFSLFNEEESDKKYIFDVRRTCKEVYDHCRRVLYNQGYDPIHVVPFSLEENVSVQLDGNGIEQESELKEKLGKIESDLRCKICMDADISTVFCPCGHMVSCEVCADQLEVCPVCRTLINKVQKAFLPVTMAS